MMSGGRKFPEKFFRELQLFAIPGRITYGECKTPRPRAFKLGRKPGEIVGGDVILRLENESDGTKCLAFLTKFDMDVTIKVRR